MAGKLSMSGPPKRGRAEVTADPNVIPFIDVMLVLLIIFMIAAPISTVDVQVEMPKSKIDPSRRPPRPTWISIKNEAAGDIGVYVMNDRVQWNEIGDKTLDAWKVNTRNEMDFLNDCLGAPVPSVACRIYIRADADIPYRNVVRVMNRLQDKGFTMIGLVAEDRRQ